jgi:hypothetical protein
MAFTYKNSKGVTYILHGLNRTTSSGKKTTLYYFSKERKESALDAVPDGLEVVETPSGMLVLKKKKK